MYYQKEKIRKKFSYIRRSNAEKVKKFPFNLLFQLINRIYSNKKIKIAGYYPSDFEVNILDFLNQARKKNYITSLPQVKKNNLMVFKKWSFKEPLQVNKYGILEPKKENKEIKPELILVPLLAYDTKLNRIGYGKGYYDRCLNKISKEKKITAIGIAYSFQKHSKIPSNKFDYKLDYIFSEKGIVA